MTKKQRLIPFRAMACSRYFFQFGRFLLLLLLFADPVFLPAGICQAAGQQESIYLSKNLSSSHNQLRNLPIIEMNIRNGEDFAVSVEVETQSSFQPSIWIDYSTGEGTRTLTQGGVIKVPIEKPGSSAWTTLQLNISDDLQWAKYNFSSIKKVSVRGTQFDLQRIRFSSPSSVDELVIDFPSQDVKTISELGWSSNNSRNCFQIMQDKDSLNNSFPYLRAKGGISQSTSTPLPSSSGSGNSTGLGEWYSGMNSGWYTGWNSPLDYRYPMGYYPYSMMPYSYMSPFSSFGLGIGGPFGMGYGLGGSPLLAMGALGSPLLLGGGLSGLYGGGFYGGGLYGGFYGGGLYGGGLYGLGGVGGILGSNLGGGLFGLSGLQNPLLGVSTGDTFYNKLFSLLFEGAVPVSTVPIVLESPPISTVLPPTSTVPAVNLTPVITTTVFTGGGGGGGGGGGYTGTGGGISGGGFTGGGGGIGGGGGLIP